MVNDVAVISENDIWVVGKFYRVPFGGNDTVAYNAMHWDGVKWELKSILIRLDYQADIVIDVVPITAIKNTTDNHIWVSTGVGGASYYDGIKWFQKIIPWGSGFNTTRIWGESSNKLYFGGTNGSLTYWNGSTFTKLETGTTKNVIDMWGCGDSMLVSFQDELKSVNGLTVKNYPQTGLSGSIISVWYDCQDSLKYSMAGNGLRKKNNSSNVWQEIIFSSSKNGYRIRGTKWSDIYLIGSGTSVSHFNGKSWKVLTNEIPKPANDSPALRFLSVNGNYGAIIGLGFGNSYIIRFKHL